MKISKFPLCRRVGRNKEEKEENDVKNRTYKWIYYIGTVTITMAGLIFQKIKQIQKCLK